MEIWWFTKEALRQIEEGIDKFNKESTMKAGYPKEVHIEHEGLKFTVPFGEGDAEQKN